MSDGFVAILSPDGSMQPLVPILDRDGSPQYVGAESTPWWEQDRELELEVARASIQALPRTGLP